MRLTASFQSNALTHRCGAKNSKLKQPRQSNQRPLKVRLAARMCTIELERKIQCHMEQRSLSPSARHSFESTWAQKSQRCACKLEDRRKMPNLFWRTCTRARRSTHQKSKPHQPLLCSRTTIPHRRYTTRPRVLLVQWTSHAPPTFKRSNQFWFSTLGQTSSSNVWHSLNPWLLSAYHNDRS